jgi:hypothetical protein
MDYPHRCWSIIAPALVSHQRRLVGGGVVYHNHLPLDVADVLVLEVTKGSWEQGLAVVTANHDGNPETLGRAIGRCVVKQIDSASPG